MTVTSHTTGMFAPVRQQWLELYDEEILDPAREIIDAHHHLWCRPSGTYLLDEMLADLGAGHNVVATVFVDCGSMYRADGPEAMRPVGEVEFANGIAAMSSSGAYGNCRICAGIVSSADLLRGSRIRPVLEAQKARGGDRFRGIRRVSSWDGDEEFMRHLVKRQAGLLLDPRFREGFACLASLDLSFDAFLFHPQIPELIDLARTFPETKIVLDHVGGPIGQASYAKDPKATFAGWRSHIRELATCENVYIKLGGLGMRLGGFGFDELEKPASSVQLAEAWAPYIETCIESFGPSRSMFESNFPPDKGTCSYTVLWNAFKRITLGCSEAEKEWLFAGSARKFYRLEHIASIQMDGPV